MAFAMQKQRMAMAVANSMAMSEGDASDNLKQDIGGTAFPSNMETAAPSALLKNRNVGRGLMISNVALDPNRYSIVQADDADPFIDAPHSKLQSTSTRSQLPLYYSCPLPQGTTTFINFNAGRAISQSTGPSAGIGSGNFKVDRQFIGKGEFNTQSTPHTPIGIAQQRYGTGFTPMVEATKRFAKLKRQNDEPLTSKSKATFFASGFCTDSENELEVVKKDENGTGAKGMTVPFVFSAGYTSTLDGGFAAGNVNSTTESKKFAVFDFKQCRPMPKIVLRTTRKEAIGTVFHPFLRLPIELQLMVWDCTIPGARTVRVHVSKTLESFRPLHGKKLPAVLHVCCVSRRLAFQSLHGYFATPSKPVSYIYFNPKIDILKLSLRSAQRMATVVIPEAQSGRDQIRDLEIAFTIFWGPEMWLAMAELVLASPHRAWPMIQSWRFPGKRGVGKPKAAQKAMMSLTVKRVDREHYELPAARDMVSKAIGERFEAGRTQFGEETQIGLHITYEGPPRLCGGCY